MSDKILVTRSSMPDYQEYCEEIKDLWDSRWLTNMGVKHKKLQQLLCNYLGVENIDLFTNGHTALELAIQAMGLEGEVITTSFTFASTTHAIVRNGLKPVFCDVNLVDYTIDTDKIEQLITDRTCAIIPVHVYGNICNVEAIESIAKKHNLKVIYDAAHTFGVRYNGRGIGTWGDASCFSFHATKVFNTIEGGAVCFKDKAFGECIGRLKNFGLNCETADFPGANGKMNEFCAAMGICNLRHIDAEIQKRGKVYERYVHNLQGIQGVTLCPQQQGVESNYAYFPVVFNEKEFGSNRDKIVDELDRNGIYARKYFYPITSQFACYKNDFDSSLTPNALYVSLNVLTLPMYADLDLNDVDRICSIILNCAN